jgi:hypothetical protein
MLTPSKSIISSSSMGTRAIAAKRWVARAVGIGCMATLAALSGCGGDDPAERAGNAGAGGSVGGGTWGSGGSGWAGMPAAGGTAGQAGAAGAAGNGGTAASAGAGGSGNEAGTGGAPGNDCPRVRIKVAVGASLNVRPQPNTSEPAVGNLPNGAIVDVVSQMQGQDVNGTTLWFEITYGTISGYISAAYAECTLDQAPLLAPPSAWYLPLACSKTAKISQGNFGSFSHSGKAAYAFDFAIGVGTPMVAMADGIVHHVYDQTGPGDPCYDGGDSSCYPYANLVVLLHGDGSTSIYKHLSQVSVSLGQFIARGTTVGLSGSSGYSTGPHAHVMRQEDCGVANCQSIPLQFADVAGDGVPDTGETVTSGNCP